MKDIAGKLAIFLDIAVIPVKHVTL